MPQVLPLFSKGTGWTTCCVAGFGECRVLGEACGMPAARWLWSSQPQGPSGVLCAPGLFGWQLLAGSAPAGYLGWVGSR